MVELRYGFQLCRDQNNPLKIWLGTGGSPASVYRAAQLEVPMFLGILGGTPEHWGQYCHAADLAVAVHGFVGDNDQEAKKTFGT